MRLIITPQPSTKSSEGFQSFPIHKNDRIFFRRVIPETRSPIPKRNPTIKLIALSLAIYLVYLAGEIFFFSTAVMMKGSKIPTIKQIFAEAK